MARVKILYVMGTGHSGSTVLDIVLGSHPRLFGCGELVHFSSPRTLQGDSCSCGAKISECEFWTQVYGQWSGKVGAAELKDLDGSRRAFERLRSLPRLLFFPPRGRGIESYSKLTRAVYESILETSGKEVVVDSSKGPVRALMLSSLPWADVHILHLVRDGRAVAWSYYKKLLRNVGEEKQVGSGRRLLRILRFSLEWVVVHLTSEFVKRRCGCKHARIRYEDFVADPVACFQKVGEQLGIDLDAGLSVLSADRSTSHFSAALPGRQPDPNDLQADSEGRPRMENENECLRALPLGHDHLAACAEVSVYE